MQTQVNREVVNVKQACAILGISRTRLYKLIEDGKIRVHKPFKRKFYLIKEELITDFAKL